MRGVLAAVVLFVVLATTAPSYAFVPAPPNVKKLGLECSTRGPEKSPTTVCALPEQPHDLFAERWAGLIDLVMDQFPKVHLGSPIEYYILPYEVYERRLFKRYPELRYRQADGKATTLADTYVKKDRSAFVVETFYFIDDMTVVHEFYHNLLPVISLLLHDHDILGSAVNNFIASQEYKDWLKSLPPLPAPTDSKEPNLSDAPELPEPPLPPAGRGLRF